MTRPPKLVSALALEVPITTKNPTNAREHWGARAKRVKAQRAAVGLMLRANGVGWRLRPLQTGERLHVRLVRVSPRRMDDDGSIAALKHVRDEVAAFFCVDDGSPLYAWTYAQAVGKPSAVRIELAVMP